MMRIENIQQTGQRIELNKLVIKLGSAVIAGQGGEVIDKAVMRSLADSVARLCRQGVQVMIVSSGAVGMGRSAFPDFAPKTIPDRQALAALGQVGLMHAYKELFNRRDFRVAQILLTRGDIEDRRRYLNIRYTLERLLELGVVPVINENDTVTIEELKFGDNDELSAMVAAKMDADLLVVLSVAEGLYESDPGAKKRKGSAEKPQVIPVVERIDAAVQGMAGKSRSSIGTGGMNTKLRAMELANAAGVHAIIAGGKTPGMIDQILTGQFKGTYFVPRQRSQHLNGRTRWIGFGRKPRGSVWIDAGAVAALVEKKKSLLAAGIVKVEGDFQPGDTVEVVDADGQVVAKGVVSYSAGELDRIKGLKTAQIHKELGLLEYEEAIHRDNMVIL